MPFGLRGAPAAFQRLVDRVLRGAEEYAAPYIDDIVVFMLMFFNASKMQDLS